MTTDYEFLVPTFCICMYKNMSVASVGPPSGRGPMCLAHSAHPIATPMVPATSACMSSCFFVFHCSVLFCMLFDPACSLLSLPVIVCPMQFMAFKRYKIT